MNAKVSIVVDGKADFGIADLPFSSHFSRIYAHGQGGYIVKVEGEVSSSLCQVVVEVPSIPFVMCRTGLVGDTCTDIFKKNVQRSYADMMKAHPVIFLSQRQQNAIYLYSHSLSLSPCVEVSEQRWQVSGVLKGKTMTFSKTSTGGKACTEVSVSCKHERRGEFLSLLTQFVVEAGADVSMAHERYESALVPYTLTSGL